MHGGHEIEQALEADGAHRSTCMVRGLLHENPQQVVGDLEHTQGLVSHLRSADSEELKTQGGLDVAQAQLDLPTPGVEGVQLDAVEELGLGEGGPTLKESNDAVTLSQMEVLLAKKNG